MRQFKVSIEFPIFLEFILNFKKHIFSKFYLRSVTLDDVRVMLRSILSAILGFFLYIGTSLIASYFRTRGSVKMFTAAQKIHKDRDAEPTEFEENAAQALFDLENTNQQICLSV